jgi:hypothetical protein
MKTAWLSFAGDRPQCRSTGCACGANISGIDHLTPAAVAAGSTRVASYLHARDVSSSSCIDTTDGVDAMSTSARIGG